MRKLCFVAVSLVSVFSLTHCHQPNVGENVENHGSAIVPDPNTPQGPQRPNGPNGPQGPGPQGPHNPQGPGPQGPDTPPRGPGTYAKDIAVGHDETCVILGDDSIKCWGSRWRQVPTPASDEKFVSIAAGTFHFCGIKKDSKIKCWGAMGNHAELKDIVVSTLAMGEEFTCYTDAAHKAHCIDKNVDAVSTKGIAGGKIDLNFSDVEFAEISAGIDYVCGRVLTSKTVKNVANESVNLTANHIYCFGQNADKAKELPSSTKFFNAAPNGTFFINASDIIEQHPTGSQGVFFVQGSTTKQDISAVKMSSISAHPGGYSYCALSADKKVYCNQIDLSGFNPKSPKKISYAVEEAICAIDQNDKVLCVGNNTHEERLKVPAELKP